MVGTSIAVWMLSYYVVSVSSMASIASIVLSVVRLCVIRCMPVQYVSLQFLQP